MEHSRSAIVPPPVRDRDGRAVAAVGKWALAVSRGLMVSAALLLAAPAGAISFQGTICTANKTTTGTTLTCQPSATISGDLVVLSIAWTSNAGTVSAVDDGAGGNAYTCFNHTDGNTGTLRDVVCVRPLSGALTSSNTI